MLALEALASGDAPPEQLWSSLIARKTPKVCALLPKVLALPVFSSVRPR
jgi:hypothetical protein